MISSQNKIVLWLVLFFIVLILVILKRERLGGMKTPLLALMILLGITIPDRFFTIPYFHRPGGGGEILFQPSYESNTPDLNNLTYKRMEKLRNITKVKNNLKSTIREIDPVLKSYQKDKNTFDVASNCGQTLPNFWYSLDTEGKINWLKNQDINPSSEEEYNWSVLSTEESEEAKKTWITSQEENFNRGCQASTTNDVKHKLGWEKSLHLTQDRLNDTQKILNDKLGYVSNDINDWDKATVNTSSSLLRTDSNPTYCYQCPTPASTDLDEIDSSNACKQIPCPINSNSSISRDSSGGGSNKNKKGWWLPGKKIEHFTSDCQIKANLEGNKDTDFFFLANSKSQNVNQCEEPPTIEDNPPSIPSQKDNLEDYNKYRLSHMQYTEDNRVDNSNAWRQFEREKICFKPTCPDVPECISGQALIYLQQKDPNTPAGGVSQNAGRILGEKIGQMCFQTQPANFEECSRRSCQKSIVLENNRQKEWKKNSASNPISTLDQEQEESCIKSAESQKTTIEKRHRGENSRYGQFLKLYESASKNPNDSLKITEFHRAINSFAGLDRNIAYRDVINPTTLQPLTEKEKKILKTLFIKDATSDIGCVGYNSDDSGQNFNQIKDTNACQTYGDAASDYLYSDAFGENWGIRDTTGRFSEYGSSAPLPQNPEMEKLKKRLSLLGVRRDMLEGEAKLLLKENLIDTSPEEMSFNDRIKNNTLKKWCDTLPISSELQCRNGTSLEEAEQLVNKYVADRFMSIKNSCDTKVTGGICYDTSNNKGVCIRNDVRDFEKELEIYGNLSREKCQFTDPTTNTKKDMEFYYLTTVPSLDLSIKEKTPVQFKLNTPIPTPEPSVGKLFKFNNKKGIIGHVDNIGENIELSYLFVISNQREEEDRMDAENIVKGTIYGKLKVAPNSEYTFTKPKEGSPTIVTPIGTINTEGIYNLQVEYNATNDTLETFLARELEKYNPNINLEKLSRYLDTFGRLVRVSDKEQLFNEICPAMKVNTNQCYTAQYLQKNPPSKKQKSIINRIKGLVERITLDFSSQKQSELEYFDQRLEKSLVSLGLKPVELK